LRDAVIVVRAEIASIEKDSFEPTERTRTGYTAEKIPVLPKNRRQLGSTPKKMELVINKHTLEFQGETGLLRQVPRGEANAAGTRQKTCDPWPSTQKMDLSKNIQDRNKRKAILNLPLKVRAW